MGRKGRNDKTNQKNGRFITEVQEKAAGREKNLQNSLQQKGKGVWPKPDRFRHYSRIHANIWEGEGKGDGPFLRGKKRKKSGLSFPS